MPRRERLRFLGAARFMAAHRWRLLALFVGVIVPMYVFGRLAEDVWHHEGFAFDGVVLDAVHARASAAGDAVMVFVTQLGSTRGLIPLAALALALMLRQRRVWNAAFFAAAAGGAALMNLAVKAVFRRDRPHLWLSPAPETDYGFPSGHAMGSAAVIGALIVLAWPTRWRWPVAALGGAFVAAVGLSRVYLGVHFPSDVLAAWAASAAWVVGLSLVVRARVPSSTSRAARDGGPPAPAVHPGGRDNEEEGMMHENQQPRRQM